MIFGYSSTNNDIVVMEGDEYKFSEDDNAVNNNINTNTDDDNTSGIKAITGSGFKAHGVGCKV